MRLGLLVNLVSLHHGVVSCTSVRNIYWNTSTASQLASPLTVVVNEGNPLWEYDQVNIICPVARQGEQQEQHIIYSVQKEEFEQCRVTSPKPVIVAICNRPDTLMYFTLTFRSFTPSPGGLEFRPGQDYYFVSTSSRRDLHRRQGGFCQTSNMRMVFRVAQSKMEEEVVVDPIIQPVSTPEDFWSKWWNTKVTFSEEENLSNHIEVDSPVEKFVRYPEALISPGSPLHSGLQSVTASNHLLLLSLVLLGITQR